MVAGADGGYRYFAVDGVDFCAGKVVPWHRAEPPLLGAVPRRSCAGGGGELCDDYRHW